MKKVFTYCCFILLTMTEVGAIESKNVVVTIKPLQALVQGVLGDTGTAELLLPGYMSPHDVTLKPSQLKLLQQASILFYIDDRAFETFLHDVLAILPPQIRKSSVAQQADLMMLKLRQGGVWETHDDPVRKPEVAIQHRHHKQYYDMHVWLDIDNAKKIVMFIAHELSAVYVENRNLYQANARVLMHGLDNLDLQLTAQLAKSKGRPFIVLHDAYQYFERRYGLTAVGAITLSPDESLSVQRIRKIRSKIQQAAVVCVFREPQFSDKLINTVIQDNPVKTSVLDPMGINLHDGANSYFRLLENLAKGFSECLS